MTFDRMFRVGGIVAIASCLLAPLASAEKITVGENGINTIQGAVLLALSNGDLEDTVCIPKGTYDETVCIDLTGTNQTSLVVQRSGKKGTVVINGEGTGNPAIKIDGVDNVTLKDLTLNSADNNDGVPALTIDDASNIHVEKVSGTATDDAGVATGPDTLGVTLKNCEFSGMLLIGFDMDGKSHTLDKCTANACGDNGVILRDSSSNCQLTKVTANSNGGFDATHTGYVDVNGDGHYLDKCKVIGMGMDGIAIEGTGHRVNGCTVSDALQACIYVDDSQATITNCDASGGIFGFMGGGVGTVVEGGSFSNNSSHGLAFSFDGTQIRNVKADKNGGDGVQVITADGVSITDSSFKKNAGEAVNINGGSDCWVANNTAKGGEGFVDNGTDNAGTGNNAKNDGQNDF